MKYLKIHTKNYKDDWIEKYYVGFAQVSEETFYVELHRDKIKKYRWITIKRKKYYVDKKGKKRFRWIKKRFKRLYWIKRKGFFVYSKRKKLYYKSLSKREKIQTKVFIKSEARLFTFEDQLFETWKKRLADGILYNFRKHVSIEIFRNAMLNNLGIEKLKKHVESMVRKMKILYKLRGILYLRGFFVVDYFITTRYGLMKMTHFVAHKKYYMPRKEPISDMVDEIIKNLMTTNSIFTIVVKRIDLFMLKKFKKKKKYKKVKMPKIEVIENVS